MHFAILPLTDVLLSIGIGKGALAVVVAIPELTDVLVSIGEGIGDLAVVYPVSPMWTN